MKLTDEPISLISLSVTLDGGPVYAETNWSNIIVEPYNAISSLLILAPAVYWAFRLRGQYNKYPFVTYCMPLLFLGGLGSTLFHAFRNSSFFLWLDVLPTLILTMSVAVYFWIKVLRRWWVVAISFSPLFLIRFIITDYFTPHTAINISYFLTGTLIFLPMLILFFRTNFQHVRIAALSLLMLVLALIFRKIDPVSKDMIPIGTHFMWHLLSGVGAYYLALFLYMMRRSELMAIKT